MKKEKPEISDEELEKGMPELDLELDESDEDNVDLSEKYDALMKRVPPVTNLRYVHDFCFDELDTIINALYQKYFSGDCQ